MFYHYPAYLYDLGRQLNIMCFASYLWDCLLNTTMLAALENKCICNSNLNAAAHRTSLSLNSALWLAETHHRSSFLPTVFPSRLQQRRNTLFSSPGSLHFLFSPFIRVEQNSRVAELLEKVELCEMSELPPDPGFAVPAVWLDSVDSRFIVGSHSDGGPSQH